MKSFSHHITVLLLLLFQHSNLTFADGISSMTPSVSPYHSMSPSMRTIDDGESSSPTLADDLSETSNSPTVDGDNVGDVSQIPSQSPSSAGDDSPVNDNMLVPTLSLAPTMPIGSSNAPSISPQPSVADPTVDGIPTISLQPSGSMQPQMNTHFPHHTMAPHHTFPPHPSRAPTGTKPSSSANANPNNSQGQGQDGYESLQVPAFILGGVVILSAAFCVAQRVKRYRQFQGVRESADMNWDLELSTYQPGLT
jgi:hypothetical protein